MLVVNDESGLLASHLRPARVGDEFVAVHSQVDFSAALDRAEWDLVCLCDGAGWRDARALIAAVHRRMPAVPIIVVSNDGSAAAAMACLHAGADDYVSTGDDLLRLPEAVETVIDRAAQRRKHDDEVRNLRVSEERYRVVAELTTDYPYEVRFNPDGTLVREWSTASFLEVTGYTLEEMADRTGRRGLVHPDDLATVLEQQARLLAGEAAVAEFRIVAKQGVVRWVRNYARSVRHGDAVRIYGAIQDITQRKQAEDDKSALLEIANAVSGTVQLDEILDRVHERTAALLPCDRIGTYYWIPDRNVFRLVSAYGVPEDLQHIADVEFSPDLPAAQRLMARQMVVVNDVVNQQWVSAELLAAARIAAAVAAPLVAGDRLIGVLVGVRNAGGPQFLEREVQLFEGIARQLSLAITTADSYRVQGEEREAAAALARVGQELISSLYEPVILDRLCRLTIDVLGCDVSYTLLWRPEEDMFAPVAAANEPPERWEEMRAVRISRDIFEVFLRQFDGDDAQQFAPVDYPEQPLAGLASRYGLTRILYMALRRGGDIFGVHVAAYRGRQEPFVPLQLRVARGIAHLGAMALDHARLVEALKGANRLKSEFVATMSHELRSPLNVVLGYTDLLLAGEFGPVRSEQAVTLQRVERSARQLLELIEGTLDLSRLDSGRVQLELSDVRVVDLMREVEVETRDGNEAISVTFETAAALPPLRTDVLKLKVILKNLIGNAVKFANPGSVTVRVGPNEGGIEFAVADTGIGIPAESLALIFEPFRQLDSSATRRYGGVGLGLYIVRRLVNLLGGKVSVESEVGCGSCFTISIPCDGGIPESPAARGSTG